MLLWLESRYSMKAKRCKYKIKLNKKTCNLNFHLETRVQTYNFLFQLNTWYFVFIFIKTTYMYICICAYHIHLMSPLRRVLKNIFNKSVMSYFPIRTLFFPLFKFQIFFQKHWALMVFPHSQFFHSSFSNSLWTRSINTKRMSFDSFHSVKYCPYALSFYRMHHR